MNQDHVFVDIASNEKSISAIAAVRTNYKGKVITAFSDTWDQNEPSKTVEALSSCILKQEYGKNYIVIAHFAEADKALLRESGGGNLFKGRAWLDTSQIAWPFVYNDLAGERSLEALCVYFEVRNTAPDTATGDCEALVRLYWAMMGRLKLGIIGEEAIRDYGGNTVKRIRDWAGI